MLSKYVHQQLGIITLSQSRRCTRISISIKASGEVRLSYPLSISTKRALAFLETRTEWVEQTRHRMESRCGKQKCYTPQEIEQLRQEAKKRLPARTAELAKEFGFEYGKVTIRASRSKWGCCTGANNISLSLFLMTLPPHLQDFVILHELCHTKHHDHSPRFHALLNHVTKGREQEFNRQLRGIRKALHIRKGAEDDLDRIMELIYDAQQWFHRQQIDQWQDGYPTAEIIEGDITRGENYIIEHRGEIVATAVVSFAGEPTYEKIHGRGWLNEQPYAVVHRIAVADSHRRMGIAQEILHFTEELCHERGVEDIRIDTHRDNAAMRSLLKKSGYTHCGRITLLSGAEREAFHKNLCTKKSPSKR